MPTKWEKFKEEVSNKLTPEIVFASVKGQRQSTGDEISGLCPLHGETNPSFSFNSKTLMWKCHAGGCIGEEGGDAFSFIQLLKDVDFRGALALLAATVKIPLPAKVATKPPIPEKSVQMWQEALHKKYSLMNFLIEKRGLTEETIKEIEIGFDLVSQRYTIPVRDKIGKLTNIRRYSPVAEGKDKMLNYVFNKIGYGSGAQLFCVDKMSASGDSVVFFCEGEFDCMLLHQYGFNAVSGIHGSGKFFKEWVSLVKDKEVVFIYDCDKAGVVDSAKHINTYFRNHKKPVKNIFLHLSGEKGDNDVSDYFLKHGKTPDDLWRLIKNTSEFSFSESEEIKRTYDKELLECFKPATGTVLDAVKFSNYLTKKYNIVMSRGGLHYYKNGKYLPEGEKYLYQKLMTDIYRANYSSMKAREDVRRLEDLLWNVTTLDDVSELINVKNGMLDWGKAFPELVPHSPDVLSTAQLPIVYDPEATCPVIERFIKSVVPPDCVDLVYELFGYLMIPDTRLEKSFVFIGTGANGKTTLLHLIQAFLGEDNYTGQSLQELCHNAYRPAELAGKLANLCPDLGDKIIEDSSMFKRLVSGDRFAVERKYAHPFMMTNFARLIFATNGFPLSKDTTEAYLRRWVLVRFPNEFNGANRDTMLRFKLTTQEELSGLLNKAIAGLKRLMTKGAFSEPKSVIKELEEYQLYNDSAKAFIDECCVTGDDKSVKKSTLYTAYKEWSIDNGYKPLGKRKFNEHLKMVLKYEERRASQTDRSVVWLELGLVEHHIEEL